MSEKTVIDHRIYTIKPRGMAEFLEVFETLAMPVLLRTLGRPLGFYVSDIGPLNQVVHLWGYESLADYDRRRKARRRARRLSPRGGGWTARLRRGCLGDALQHQGSIFAAALIGASARKSQPWRGCKAVEMERLPGT